jgi:hypothetical protein
MTLFRASLGTRLQRGVIGTLGLTLLSTLGLPALGHAGRLRSGEYLKTQGSAQVQVVGLKTCSAGLVSRVQTDEDSPDGEEFRSDEALQTELALTLSRADRAAFSEHMTCKERDDLLTILEVTSLTITKYAIISACTGLGVTVNAALSVTLLGTQFAQFIVSHLTCDARDDEKKVNAQIKQTVCEALLAQGIACNPAQLK